MNRISRKMALTGAAGLLALATLGGIAGHTVVHASSSPPAVVQTAADTDNVQQEVQSGSQQDTGAADTTDAASTQADAPDAGGSEATTPESTAPDAADTDTTQSGSQTDTP